MSTTRCLLAACAAVLALSGCRSQVTTTITAASGASAVLQVCAVFDGEAADALTPKARAALVAAWRSRTGTDPQESIAEGRRAFCSDVDYAHLSASSGVTGVSAVAMRPEGGLTRVQVSLCPAADLRGALSSSISGPDAAAVLDTELASTDVVVSVLFPGGLRSASASTGTIARDSTSVTVTRQLDNVRSGTLDALGSPDSRSLRRWWKVLAAAGGLLAVVHLVGRRRRSGVPD